MPYIPDDRRRAYLAETFDAINTGELNFILFFKALQYLDRVGKSYIRAEEIVGVFEDLLETPQIAPVLKTTRSPVSEGELALMLKGQTPINEVQLLALFRSIVALYCSRTQNALPKKTIRCCQMEFYRRHVVPYEDLKIEENGDVVINNPCEKCELEDKCSKCGGGEYD